VSVQQQGTSYGGDRRRPHRGACGRATWLSDRASRYIEAFVGRREALAIAIARFVPRLRTLVFMSVGARGLSRGRFLLIDACAAAVWVPFIMTCGAAMFSVMFGDDAHSLGAWKPTAISIWPCAPITAVSWTPGIDLARRTWRL
jgi:membrane protein DedA with SNARE-associated domain